MEVGGLPLEEAAAAGAEEGITGEEGTRWGPIGDEVSDGAEGVPRDGEAPDGEAREGHDLVVLDRAGDAMDEGIIGGEGQDRGAREGEEQPRDAPHMIEVVVGGEDGPESEGAPGEGLLHRFGLGGVDDEGDGGGGLDQVRVVVAKAGEGGDRRRHQITGERRPPRGAGRS